ncbi:solute carrier family 25 member 40-like isoform X2 [Maniola jurtina]|uniref:solute carrier family 25 member 40-like isoform X1 n=1 Tax=Maniola jurtina TaxID=191418 RepID=UPI001E689BC5|nr:solute carrier family 25 member 40-like isoform X1 [Maniola jurtina]XP_045767731.1 solute carrier family 25 member 40-like isoform X2 [Maniola jurtina]
MIREDDPQFRITPFQQMASACSGALITSLFMTPLDVVKIRLQAQQKALLSNKCYLYCNGLMEHLCPCGESAWIPRRVHFHGTIDAFYKIAKLEGVPALWSGLSPTLVLALPCTVIYFVSYEQLRYRMKTTYNTMTGNLGQPMWIPLTAGATARTIAVTIVSPLELIRTKMQSKKLTYSEINLALRQVLKYEGYRGLFRGLGSTLLRDVPFSGIYWTTFESTKRFFDKPDSEKNSFIFNFFCGSVAGSIAAFVTLPFDVVKTHQQIELGEKEIYTDGKSHQRASNMKDIARNIYSNHGIRGLFTGFLPRIFKVAPACAIMIATFEYGKQFFRTYNTQKYKEKMQRHQDILLVGQASSNTEYRSF